MLGELVAEGYDAEVHVAAVPLEPSSQPLLAIGWDGGHSPSAVIGQHIDGQVRIYASLNDLKIGVLELIEDQVIPWLTQHAPWVRKAGGGSLLAHVLDPSMRTRRRARIKRVVRAHDLGRVARADRLRAGALAAAP